MSLANLFLNRLWIATADECANRDRRAEIEFGIPLSTLMEEAGAKVFARIRERLPSGGTIVFVCGKGHNGGDGLVAARLAWQAGYDAHVFLITQDFELSSLAALQLEALRNTGSQIHQWRSEQEAWHELLSRADLVVDGLLGTGLKGRLDETFASVVNAMNESHRPVLAIDIPSGIDCDSGQILDGAVRAEETVTFALPKPFLFLNSGPEHAGTVTVADIQWPSELLNEPTSAAVTGWNEVALTLPRRRLQSHKGEHGHLLIFAGSPNMPGAALLAAKAALRAGVGLVTICSHPAACEAVSRHLPEALLHPISPQREDLILERGRYTAGVFGPGLDEPESWVSALNTIWRDWTLPCVVDADALNAIALGAKLPSAPCVLTPHPGEMGRLMSVDTGVIQSDRFRWARDCAKRFGSVALLKGAYTVSAAAGNPLLVNPTGNPGMATAGMGDVLSGVIGALLAQGIDPFWAAVSGAYWHGLAGDMCRDQIAEAGFLASEVADMLPFARTELLSVIE